MTAIRMASGDVGPLLRLHDAAVEYATARGDSVIVAVQPLLALARDRPL